MALNAPAWKHRAHGHVCTPAPINALLDMHTRDELEVTDVAVVGKFSLDGTYVLELAFNDGLRKTVDVKPLLTGIRQRLLYHDQFAQARLETGTVVWPGERIHPDQAHITDLRIEPEVLYDLDPVD